MKAKSTAEQRERLRLGYRASAAAREIEAAAGYLERLHPVGTPADHVRCLKSAALSAVAMKVGS